MKCTSFRVIKVRSFEDMTVAPSPALTLFTGPNGSGKTNLIEALSYASTGKSFRTGNDGEIIRLGQEEGTILVDFETGKTVQTIKIRLTRSQGKKIFLNDTAIRKKELVGLFRTVLFTPDELQLIKGAPQLRRRFMDMEISQVSPRYYEEFLRYSRAVQQRNSALKNAQATGRKPDLDMWDMQIAASASYLVKKRLETTEKMNNTVPAAKKAWLSDTSSRGAAAPAMTWNGFWSSSPNEGKKTPASATPPSAPTGTTSASF